MSEDVRPTFFEQQVRAAVQLSGWSYADLSRESGISASQLGRYMSGEKGLSSEALGRLLDTIGCTLSTPSKMRERKKTQGRHPKPVKRVELTPEQVEQLRGLFKVEIPPEQMHQTSEIDHLRPKRESGDRETEFEFSPQPTDARRITRLQEATSDD
jgi:transcriptional regulator with XRE-family HTH domain